MGALISSMTPKGQSDSLVPTKYTYLNDIRVRDITGREYNKLGELVPNSNVYLVVNVASNCDLAPKNYNQLMQMYDDYKDKCFTILAFPCNQFGHLEPGSPDDI